MNIDNIMNSTFGESSNKIEVTFRKTVQIRPYESETIEVNSSIDIGDKDITGAERMLISAIALVQIEYTTLCNLVYKGLITKEELSKRRADLIDGLDALKIKAETVLGKSLDSYFDTKED